MRKIHPAFLLISVLLSARCHAQSQTSQASENTADVSYHYTLMLPQYRFIDTTGYGGRVGEYDTLQQSLGGDFALNFVDVPAQMAVKTTINAITRDDYQAKSRVNVGEWLDVMLDSRSFVRHLDNNSFFGAGAISNDIVRIDTIQPESLLGVRRRMNNASARVQLPRIPVKVFVKGGWQARDGNGQLQYFDMGGDGTLTDTGCDNCHSGSQYRTYNYTTRNIAGGAEITLGPAKLTYQHEFRSFNDRMLNPSTIYGTAASADGSENIPVTPAGYYVNNVLPSHQTQDDSLQISLAVAHHMTLNSDLNYARTTDLFTKHPQNAFNADATLSWNPLSRLRAVVDFHQQNLLNNWVQTFALSTPTPLYTFGNPSLHRHWVGAKLSYRLTKQMDVETYYRRMNITRSNVLLWPQIASPHNTDALFNVPGGVSNLVPGTFSNIGGLNLHLHGAEFWDARTGYEWIGTHDPGYVTDPGISHRIFSDLTLTPVHRLSIGNDVSILLQQSFAGFLPLQAVSQQRSNRLYTDTAFLTLRPVSGWNVGGSYTYLQDNLRTDMQLANDSAVAVYMQSLVPYKQLSQSFSVHSDYEVKQRVRFRADFAHSIAHSGMRPDVNSADYPAFPGADPAAFSGALQLASGLVSQVFVPQSVMGGTADYHFRYGFDSGLRFNYGSYADRIGRVAVNGFARPDLSGRLRSYSVFMGRVW